ncbi:LysR family transcriptional regulator substrate-binding protein, partial [Salmonella enterica subsp. enterica serovar Anatum]|nr:LysR family transcriptional regulator substrate-binding protein [Salmonella enterica subsp. enterica serovar Anatum]
FRFTPGKTSLFAVFAAESRSARFSGARKSVYVKYYSFWCIFPGIVIINDCPKELVTVPLMTQQHVVCMSDKHPLAKKDSIDWEDL